MSDQDVQFAKAAFSEALPGVEYRASATNSPRPRNGARIGALSGVAVVAAAAIFAMSATTGTAPAWSATPTKLSPKASAGIDEQCRAAKSSVVVVGPGSGPVTSQGSGGVSVSAGDVPASGSLPPGGVTVGGSGSGKSTTQTLTVGSLPLLFIDSRGAMAVAVYGDATHHVVCTVDPKMGVNIDPDSGAWPAPVGTALISANPSVMMGTGSIDPSGAVTGTTRLLGTVAPSVASMTVDVPGVGTVVATVTNGYYSLFIPDSLISSNQNEWTAHVTLNDGTTHTVPIGSGAPAGVSVNPGQ
jgi:hypothetical protein